MIYLTVAPRLPHTPFSMLKHTHGTRCMHAHAQNGSPYRGAHSKIWRFVGNPIRKQCTQYVFEFKFETIFFFRRRIVEIPFFFLIWSTTVSSAHNIFVFSLSSSRSRSEWMRRQRCMIKRGSEAKIYAQNLEMSSRAVVFVTEAIIAVAVVESNLCACAACDTHCVLGTTRLFR